MRGLCLVPEACLRANAAETRWMCTSLPGSRARQLWELVKNKRGQLGCWEVSWPGIEMSAAPPHGMAPAGARMEA